MRIPLTIAITTLFVVASCTGYKQITVIGPRTFTSQSTYKALIYADGLSSDETLVLALKSNDKVHDTRKFKGSSTLSEEVELDLPTNPLDSYELMSLFVTKKNGNNVCSVKEAKIYSLSSKNFINLIQMDKPIYKAGDKVRFRVLTLDHETKPYKYNNIKVSVYHSNTTLVRTFSEARQSDFGLYENHFIIPDEPVFGNWFLDVEIDGAKTRKTFSVKDYKPPPFQVYVETQPKVAFEDGYNPSIDLKVYAKYQFDEYVKGNAKITAKVFSKNLPSQISSQKTLNVRFNGGSKNVKFELKKDLNMQFVTQTTIVEFDIEFIEEITQRRAEQTLNVEVLHKGHHIIKLTKQKNFRPGFPYKVKAEVFTLNGTPETSESLPIVMKLKYNYKEQTLSDSRTSQPSFLDNGKAYFVLNPSTDVENFTMSFEFENAKVEEVVEAKKQSGAIFLQVTFDPDIPKVGDTLKIKAHSNSLMNPLKVVVVGRKGLIYSEEFLNLNSEVKNEFTFELKVTKEMAPEASVIVFYINNNDIIYDQLKLELGYTSTNEFSIQPSSKTFKPKDIASFTLKSKPRSLVGLLAIDQNIRYLGNNNEIDENEVDSKLSSLEKLKAGSYDDKLHAELAKSNVVILQNLKFPTHLCTPLEEKYLVDDFAGRLEVIPVPNNLDEKILEWEDTSIEAINTEDDLIRKYFPDVWIFDSFKMQQGQMTINHAVPDTITTWFISGFSIHPENGLALAKPQKIKVFQDFFIKVETPNSLKVGEVFKMDVTVYNYLNVPKTIKITLQQENFELVDERQMDEKPEGCMEYYRTNNNFKSVQANSKSSATTKFFIKAIQSGKINLKIDATGPGVQDSVHKIVKVDYEGATQFKSIPILIDLKKTDNFIKTIKIEPPRDAELTTIKIEASLSGNLLGPSLDNLDKFISMPDGCGEQKMKSFALSIYAYKYLKSINSTNATLIENARNAMQKGYQEAKSLQQLNGGFKLWEKSEDSEGIWLSAYVTQLLGDAREIIEIDKDFYENSLEYLKSKQKWNGSFNDDLKGPRQDQGVQTGRKAYLTAFVMIAIAKNKKNYNNYAYIANDGANFLESADLPKDYEKAIVAYALSLANETKANEVLDSLKWDFSNLKPAAVKAIHVEVASYITLAALQLKKFNDAMRAFNFLINQRQPNGGFFSTHDTVLGLEALTAMQEYLGAQSPSMSVQFSGGISEDIDSQTDSKYVELNSKSRDITVTAYGDGMAYVNVFYQYKSKSSLSNNFIIKLDPIQETENGIKMMLKVGSNRTISNMGIVEVELPSGYQYTNGEFTSDVKKVEFDDDKSKVILYFEKITRNTLKKLQVIEATKIADVKETKSSVIKAYDYYEPENFKSTIFYEVAKKLECHVSPPTMNEMYIDEQDDLPDIRFTVEIVENVHNEIFRKCSASIINKQTVLTASGCQLSDNINIVEVGVEVWSDEQQQYDIKYFSVKFIKTNQPLRVLQLISRLNNIPELELSDTLINLQGLKCFTSLIDQNGELEKINVKMMSDENCLRYTQRKHLCSLADPGLQNHGNIGNPLVCNVNGKLNQIGIGLGVNSQNIAIYRDLRGAKNRINDFIQN